MKLSVIITSILAMQVSASFYDVFHGAVLSVQNSFGKLLSDVVTDVKETVDCTILAVEHVLSLSNDATTRYYETCGSVTNQTNSVSETLQDAASAKLEVTLSLPNNSDYLQKMIPAEIDARINETLSKVRGNYKSHDNVLNIENELAKESEQLAGVSVFVKKELDKLPHEVTTDLKKIEKQRDSEPSVDTSLQEIKVLEKRELNMKNTSKVSEIHQVIGQVLGKLDAIEATEAKGNSNNSFMGLRQQFEEWKEEESRHLSEIKSKIEEYEKIFDPGSFNRHGIESPTTVGSSEVATLPTNQSTTLQYNLTINNTNESVTNSTLGIINSAPLNKTIPPIDLLADLNKQESSSVTANEPTTVLYTNENNSNETVTVSNPLQPSKITAIKDAILPVKRNTDSGKKESSDSAIHNNTVVINAAETAGIEMTSTSQSNINSNDTVISSTFNTMVKNTFVNATSSENVESSTSDTSEVVATLATFHVIASNDTILTSTLSYINFSTPLNVTIVPTESSTAIVNEKSSKVTAKIISDSDSIDTMLPSTSSPNLESIPISETIQSKETTLTSGKDQSITELYDPIITSTSLPTVKNTPISVSVKPEETGTTSDNKKSSTVTTKIVNDNDSNNTNLTTVSLPIANASVSGTVEPKETTTVSGNEEFSKDSNGTMITSTSLPIIESKLINKTILPEETTTASSNKEFSTETTSELTTTSKIVNENHSDTTITSTPNSIISTPESEAIQAIDTTTISTSDEESLGSIANNPTGTHDYEHDHDGAEDDDSSAAMVTMTPGAISESIPQKNVSVAENYETLASTTNSPVASPATLRDTDSNSDAFTSAEITTVSEVIEPVKSTAPTENVKPSILSTTPVTIPDKVTDKNTDTIETVTITTKNADSAVVTEIIQTDEISTASEEQELSSTSITTQSPIIVTTSTVFPPTERIPTSGNITASRNEENLKNSPTLKANTSRILEILYSPDLNVRTPPLTIIESVPVNREWLTSNKPKQQNYSTNEAPRHNYEFNAPISLSDPLLQTAQPLINTEVPMYGQAVPPIMPIGTPKLLTPDRLILNAPNQQPKIENKQTAFEFFKTVDKLSHSDSPFGPDEDIKKIANIPSPTLITNAPRKSKDPQRINYENPSYVPTPKYPIDPYSFDNRAPPNIYRPQGLTTERPKKTAGRAKNYKSPPMDYDSFLHTPPRNSEAHQRALKEAQQLIANSKRAERIIKNIMKNRNKFNAKTVFG